MSEHAPKVWTDPADGSVECLLCPRPIERTLFGWTHVGQAAQVREPAPEDADAFNTAVTLVLPAVRTALPDGTDPEMPEQVARAAVFALLDGGRLTQGKRRRPSATRPGGRSRTVTSTPTLFPHWGDLGPRRTIKVCHSLTDKRNWR